MSFPIGDEPALRVSHTPGHSWGSVTFKLPRSRAPFGGDAIPLFGNLPVCGDLGESIRSPGRHHQIGGLSPLRAAWKDPVERGSGA
ncbi:MAG: hypothetical protein QMD46_06600 [Methanomicrobiales archaeon]|nr:hypothetical protein [Methanomicrobiales archaeon]